ncbi:NAD(P)/FAD-dependent oxidoreductase [Mobilitalea sibirica]|uniref:NAD(P)/FAD-dependent oxidoreductase n=1 Tax=Mobilitalea sibirica TaxID=1462919 RepID=A0A8J7H8B1_9FIRM|nr:NAD(P)/FAD-dependent oxidoreductase [Mobilitalea sibirica]
MNFDVIIVGAGASGLMAAITAARCNRSVLVIEQKDKAGKKILATGNGKCNYTNLVQLPECYRSNDSAFAMKVLSCFDVHKTINFFRELGIYPKERNGYLYPNSEQAVSVVEVLLMECDRLGVTFVYEEKVIEITQPYFTVQTEYIGTDTNNKLNSNVKTNNIKSLQKSNRNYVNQNRRNLKTHVDNKNHVIRKKYYGRNLILATGGCASPKLGSDGSGYSLSKSLGHSVIKPLPALVQLRASDKYCKTLSGVRSAAKVTAFMGNSKLALEEGEVLFTDYGISGIPVMQMSRFVAKALDQKQKVALEIDFFADLSMEEVTRLLKERISYHMGKTLEQMLVGFLNHKLSYIMIKEAKLDPYRPCNTLKEHEIILLTKQIKSFHMNIIDTNSFENAQVCSGGVDTKELNPKTMESKLLKNLYLIGELVDVDGTCGGYNLQWAWSSGYLAGQAAGMK